MPRRDTPPRHPGLACRWRGLNPSPTRGLADVGAPRRPAARTRGGNAPPTPAAAPAAAPGAEAAAPTTAVAVPDTATPPETPRRSAARPPPSPHVPPLGLTPSSPSSCSLSNYGGSAGGTTPSIDLIEIRALRGKFAQFDVEGKAVIGADAFRNLFAQVMQLPPHVCEVERNALLDFAYGLFDASGQHTLHLRDFVAGCVVLGRGTEQERLRYLFQMYDMDKSGGLSVVELERVFNVIRSYALVRQKVERGDGGGDGEGDGDGDGDLDLPANANDGGDSAADLAHKALNDFDVDHDGQLGFDEFAVWCEKEPDTKAWMDVLCDDTAKGIARLREEREREMVLAELANMGFGDNQVYREGYNLVEAAASSSGTVGVGGSLDGRNRAFGVSSVTQSSAGTDEESALRTGESAQSGSTLREGESNDGYQVQRSVSGRPGTFEIDYQSLTLIKQIGEGSFARVWRGKWLDIDVAIKILKSGKSVGVRLSAPPGGADGDGGLGGESSMLRSRPCARVCEGSVGETLEPEMESNCGLESRGPWRGGAAGSAAGGGVAGTLDVRDRNHFLREIGLLTSLRHPNVLLLMGACTDPRYPLCIVSELVEGGSLQSHLHGGGGPGLSPRHALKLGLDVARGMLYLHSSTPIVLHRDLKSANILVENFDDEELSRATIIDFGLSRLDSTTDSRVGAVGHGLVGSLVTMAPECMRSEMYQPASDVYSFGIVLWEMFTGRQPYAGSGAMQLMYKVGVEGKRPELRDSDGIPPSVVQLIQQCWAQDPGGRPDFTTVVKELNHINRSHFQRVGKGRARDPVAVAQEGADGEEDVTSLAAAG
jgi:serine/threonine protein kinase/Ca2+-binding EF-hand superfamily protein